MSTKPIRRITLFKIPSEENQQKLLDIYREMPAKAVKVLVHLSKLSLVLPNSCPQSFPSTSISIITP
jgi:hypothetical protein